jgi:hypothetical protein
MVYQVLMLNFLKKEANPSVAATRKPVKAADAEEA